MNDELLMNNYLLILKSTVEVFVHGTLESSNSDVREILNDGLNQILESQSNTYNLMSENNWYKNNNVDSSVIVETLTNC